ncbi:MAG: hypothetical protein RJA70_3922 [Pseudomonadota bacterium]|jgi:hypothetical protein
MRRCRGDLCATGVYISTHDPVGSPGDVVLLRLASTDQAQSVQTLARVARVIRQDDRARGARIIGAGFEFLPLDGVQDDVLQLLHYTAECELKNFGLLRFDDSVQARASYADQEIQAELRSLGAEQLTLSSNARVPVGELLRIAVEGDLGRETQALLPRLCGSVVSVTRETYAGPERFSLLVRHEGTHAPGELRTLVRCLLAPTQVKRRRGVHHDLSGQLCQLPIREVIDLLKRERCSGVLSAGTDQAFFSFEVRDGELCACDGETPGPNPLDHLLTLEDGEFRFKSRRPAQLETLAGPAARLMHDVLSLGNRA